MRRCSTCDAEKKLSEFNRDAARKSGVQSKCRECQRKVQQMSYASRPWKNLSEGERRKVIRAAQRFYASNPTMDWTTYARNLGLSRKTLRRHADPEYARVIQERDRAYKANFFAPSNHMGGLERAPAADVAARLAEIPSDTRSPAQRLTGDPIPGDLRRTKDHLDKDT